MFTPKLFHKSEEVFLCGQLRKQTVSLESVGVWLVGLACFSIVIHGGKEPCLCLGACLHLKDIWDKRRV